MSNEIRYQILLSSSAKRALKKLPPELKKRIDTEILALSRNPRPTGVKALQGNTNILRVRVGTYRILYQVEDERLIIIIIKVGHRREVYRDL